MNLQLKIQTVQGSTLDLDLILQQSTESTGSYWIPAYEFLEAKGFDVCLVNATFVKNAPGRKTDVED